MKGPPMALKGLAVIGPEIPGPLPAAAALGKKRHISPPLRFGCRLRRRRGILNRGGSPAHTGRAAQPLSEGSRKSRPRAPESGRPEPIPGI